jgi:enediyne biosynthesis protein E4
VAFDDESIKAGMSVAVGDYDRDGWLDLQIAEWGPKGTGDRGFLDPVLPDRNRLLHNRGKKGPGHFDDVTVAAYAELDEPGLDGKRPNTFGYSNALADFDGDDWPDLALAADFRSSRFRWNEHGKFSEATSLAGTGKETFGMGATIGDLDGDGRLDWFVTSISDAPTCVLNLCNSGETGNHLYLYKGNRHFEDAALKLGVAQGYWGWGAEMLDFDNDGDLDLVQTNGTNFPFVPQDNFFTHDAMRFWRHDGDTFVEASAALGLTDTREGKAVVTFDYDRDGDLDVFIVNNASTPVLYRNDTRGGDWLRVRVLTDNGRDAIGAKLRVTIREGVPPLVSHIGLGSRFLSQSEQVAHFGLGAGSQPVAKLVVHWSDTGKEKTLTNLARNQLVVVTP